MEIVKLNQRSYKKVLGRAVGAIKNGKVLVCPTDTVYGLICDAENKKAVERLFKIKKRPRKKPIPMFVKDIRMAKKFAKINSEQEKFLRKIWPGKVTVILRCRTGTLGLRVPRYKFINELLFEPLAETSANISGRPASTKIKEVIKQFRNQEHQPDLIIDAGDLSESKPSTVIDLTKGFKILRK